MPLWRIYVNYTEKKKIISEILQNSPLEYPLPKEIVKFVQDYMIQHHVHIHSLSINKLFIKKNDMFKHNNFYFHGEINGEKVINHALGVSGTKSKKNTHTDEDEKKKRLGQGMREAIGQSLFDFKKRKLFEEECKLCEICNEPFDLNNLQDIHVDHCGEKEFRHIKDEFLSVPHNLIVIDRHDQDLGLTKLLDNADKEVWIEYHNMQARLQLLCKKCNLSKGKK
jgi:hypothetical protein